MKTVFKRLFFLVATPFVFAVGIVIGIALSVYSISLVFSPTKCINEVWEAINEK